MLGTPEPEQERETLPNTGPNTRLPTRYTSGTLGITMGSATYTNGCWKIVWTSFTPRFRMTQKYLHLI